MMSSRFAAAAALVAAFAASCAGAQKPQLRGRRLADGADEMRFHVVNNASFPITLANCGGNITVPALQNKTLTYASLDSMIEASFFWVVPEGVQWDCNSGCPDCFFVTFIMVEGEDGQGSLVTRLGYEVDDEEAEDA